MEGILAIKIILAFFVGIAIIYLTALLTGKQRKAKWFKKRRQVSFFTKRGSLGEICHYGYPCTWPGLILSIAMYSAILLVGYTIIFQL